MATQTRNVLLVNGTDENAWVDRLRMVVSQLGRLDIVQKSETLDQMRRLRYDIVVVDETQLIQSYEFISQILRFSPGIRVVVVSEISDWHRARQAFQAGAADFILASANPEELLIVLREV